MVDELTPAVPATLATAGWRAHTLFVDEASEVQFVRLQVELEGGYDLTRRPRRLWERMEASFELAGPARAGSQRFAFCDADSLHRWYCRASGRSSAGPPHPPPEWRLSLVEPSPGAYAALMAISLAELRDLESGFAAAVQRQAPPGFTASASLERLLEVRLWFDQGLQLCQRSDLSITASCGYRMEWARVDGPESMSGGHQRAFDLCPRPEDLEQLAALARRAIA